jgi:RNA polymerase sigma factor (sigma-70 family)
MKIIDPGPETISAATQGQLLAIDSLVLSIQPGVFNLSVRMLGNRDDAADATQEILLKVITHLASFESRSAFTTWVFQIARNHLLTAITRAKESPEVSIDAMHERLQQGLAFGTTPLNLPEQATSTTPEDKLEARQVALGCTQNMLMTLNREERLIYVLDTVFGLPSKQAAEVLGISPDAFRQRLGRARAKLEAFTGNTCGWVNPQAACSCAKQLPVLRAVRASGTAPRPSIVAIHRSEMLEAEQKFDAFVRLCDTAALFRAHPQYQVPAALHGAIRAVLSVEGFMNEQRPLQ